MKKLTAMTVGSLLLLAAALQNALADDTNPLLFTALARGDARVLTEQGKALLSKKIRAQAFFLETDDFRWEKYLRLFKQPTIYEAINNGQRFIFVLEANHQHSFVELQLNADKKRVYPIMIPGVDWGDYLHKNPSHRVNTKPIDKLHNFMLHFRAQDVELVVGLNKHSIIMSQEVGRVREGTIPVNYALEPGPDNHLWVGFTRLSDSGSVTLVLFDHNDGGREVFNIHLQNTPDESPIKFAIPTDRPIAIQ